MAKENDQKNINDVLQASLNVHNRLFNHKHFIDGEINYLINKLEKSECKEMGSLIERIEHKNQTRLTLIGECPNLMRIEKLNEFQRKSESLLKKSNEILNLDQSNEERRKSQNNDYSRRQNEKAEEIRSVNEAKLNEMDKYYERKKIEAAKYYHELESKWDV